MDPHLSKTSWGASAIYSETTVSKGECRIDRSSIMTHDYWGVLEKKKHPHFRHQDETRTPLPLTPRNVRCHPVPFGEVGLKTVISLKPFVMLSPSSKHGGMAWSASC